MSDEAEYADPQRYAELAGFEGEWRDLFWNPDFLELMARRWGLEHVTQALDLGCGAGHWTRTVAALLPPGAQITGLDREAHFIELARKAAVERGLSPRMSFVEGAIEALPFEDESFDLVTAQLVLIHVADVELALKEILRVLKPGGILAVAEPDNQVGNLALLRDSVGLCDEDLLAVFRLQQLAERGKIQLGEGDQSVGPRLPALFTAAGFERLRAHTSDRCMLLHPPYSDAQMAIALEQELEWASEGVNVLMGTRASALRLTLAAGGREEQFDRGWAVIERWMQSVREQVEQGDYVAARGFLMYLVSGRKPGSAAG